MTEGNQMRPGDECTSWCTKCREMRLHKVRVVLSEKKIRVVCMTCDGEHLHRPNPPKSTTRSKKAKEAEKNPWPELTANVREERIRPYSISDDFSEKEYLQHTKFGLGVVTEVLDANKVKVAFEDKIRIMVCNK